MGDSNSTPVTLDILGRIDSIVDKIAAMLRSNDPIPEDPLFVLIGDFSSALKKLLTLYFESPAERQDHLRPLIGYYRQLQGYLIFLCRFPTILLVPHHNEILQTLTFIENKDTLLHDLYAKLPAQERALLHGPFRDRLERLYGAKSPPPSQ